MYLTVNNNNNNNNNNNVIIIINNNNNFNGKYGAIFVPLYSGPPEDPDC
jgi:hypothetical protein